MNFLNWKGAQSLSLVFISIAIFHVEIYRRLTDTYYPRFTWFDPMLCRLIVQYHYSPASQKSVTTKHETESVSMKRCMEVLAVFFGILSALYIVCRFASFSFSFFFLTLLTVEQEGLKMK